MSTTAVEIPGYVAGTYTIDPGHSDVAFTVRHLMVSKVRGHFTRFQGEFTLAPDPLASSVTATIELASIDTNNPQRDDDLRSADFFEADTYPTMTFRSVGLGHSQDGVDVDGELTVRGVTRPVPLALDVNGFTGDPYGGTRAGFSATTELGRGDFGISTNIPMDGGGVVIGDRIQVFLEIEAVLNPTPAGQPRTIKVMAMPTEPRVTDNPRASRYELWLGATRAGLIEYRAEPGVVFLIHTEVDSAFAGQGLGERLVAGALADLRARGLKLVPLCPFVRAYLRRHPDQADLVAGERAVPP